MIGRPGLILPTERLFQGDDDIFVAFPGNNKLHVDLHEGLKPMNDVNVLEFISKAG